MSDLERTRLANRALAAVGAAYALTTIHHVYGGLVDGSTGRLLVPLILAPPVLVGVGALLRYRRSGRRPLLIGYAAITGVVFVGLLGIFHGGYAHVYKDLIFLLGAPSQWYAALNPDEHFPPDDVFFEVTGVLEVAASALVALTTVRLLRADAARPEQTAGIPVAGGHR
ncbi:hypothetical protein [Granulicoccus phenolivorans]|uniref:hypothetical protein n=1 Tax=Granulicoccus phenolivorans TaxID=266854 RepID=UPI0004283A0E|nr:hypothetical protein [Granulicoccus phenolivorans]